MKIDFKAILFIAMLYYANMPLNATSKIKVTIAIDSLAEQIKPLEVGDQVPDLTFTSVVNAKSKEFKLSDIKGKLVILDFWATWCNSCIVAFPKLNELQNKFKDDIQVMGVTDQNFEMIKRFYDQRMEKQNLKLVIPTVTEDTTLKNYFPHQSISHVIWIGRDGKVIAITGSEEVNEENITKILNQENVELKAKIDRKTRGDINMDEPFVLEKLAAPLYTNEGVTEGGIRFKSIITKYIENIPSGFSFNYTGRIICQNIPLESMFMHAYSFENLSSGEYLFTFPHNKLKWEVGNNDLYNLPLDKNELKIFRNNKDNYYCYELIFPDFYKGPEVYPGQLEDIRFIATKIMRQDLMKWTGFKSSMELRESTVLVLSMLDSTKLISPINYEKSEIDPAFIGGTFKNTNMLHFKRSMYHFLQMGPPLIDETNYSGMLNFKLESKLTDYKMLGSELESYGLSLKEEVRTIPLLVIKK